MTLHCTYTALSLTSELKAKDVQGPDSQNGENFNVITAEQSELARKLNQANALGNTNQAQELRDRLKSQGGKRLHITSKDPNLAGVLEVFPPPEVKTLSEAYPDKLKDRISLLRGMQAKLTNVQMLHARLASLKRGVVFTHNVGSGKTRIAAYAAIAAGAKRIAFIAKSKIIGEVMKEMQDALGLKVVHIHSAEMHSESHRGKSAWNAPNARKLSAKPRLPESPLPKFNLPPKFYVISQEFLTIGGLANQTFDPYVVDILETLGRLAAAAPRASGRTRSFAPGRTPKGKSKSRSSSSGKTASLQETSSASHSTSISTSRNAPSA